MEEGGSLTEKQEDMKRNKKMSQSCAVDCLQCPKWSKNVIVTFKLFQCNWSCGLQHERGYTNWKCGQNKRKMKSRWGSDRARAAAFCNPLSDFLSPGSHLESDHHFCLVFIWTDEVIGIWINENVTQKENQIWWFFCSIQFFAKCHAAPTKTRN